LISKSKQKGGHYKHRNVKGCMKVNIKLNIECPLCETEG